MSRSRPIVGGAVVAAVLAGAPSAGAATVQSFRASVEGGSVRYEIVLCAPVGARVEFTTLLAARGGRSYVLTSRTGRQRHVCPTWRYAEPDRFPAGRYATQVRIAVGDQRLITRRVSVTLP